MVSPRLHKPLLNITQKFMRLTRSVKPANLLQITKNNKDPMLIFTNRNETCKWLAMFLRENNLSCSNISGDMNYHIRIEQWNQFVKCVFFRKYFQLVWYVLFKGWHTNIGRHWYWFSRFKHYSSKASDKLRFSFIRCRLYSSDRTGRKDRQP